MMNAFVFIILKIDLGIEVSLKFYDRFTRKIFLADLIIVIVIIIPKFGVSGY